MKKLGLRYITIKDVLISVLISIMTFGYFFDNNISKDVTEVNIIGITIGSLGFEDFVDMIYFIKMKLLIIIFSTTWYFTCKHWWRSAILVILTIELLKLVSALNANQKYIDEIEFVTSLPITIPIILLIIFISKKINHYNLSKDLRIEIDIKINKIFFDLNDEKKESIVDLEDSFFKLKKKQKTTENKFTYLSELIEMRDNFYKE